MSRAGNQIVSNCNNLGAGSLRAAIAQALSGDSIDLTRLRCSSITLADGALETGLSDLILTGPGASALAINGDGQFYGVIDHTGNGTLTVSGLTLAHGVVEGKGGCIYSKGNVELRASTLTSCSAHSTTAVVRGGGVYAKGNLTLTDTTISSSVASGQNRIVQGGGAFVGGNFIANSSAIELNQAHSALSSAVGGGLFVSGNVDVQASSILSNRADYSAGLFVAGAAGHTAILTNSTVAENSAAQLVGGIYANVPLTLRNSTIANNSAKDSLYSGYTIGAGLQLFSTTADIQSTIIAKNTSDAGSDDVGGLGSTAAILPSSSNNLIGTSSLNVPAGNLRSDPKLGNLTRVNGGPGFLPLLSASPAIDAGSNTSNAHYDQRGNGNARVVGLGVDIGAYERQSSGVVTIVGNCADGGAGSLRDSLFHAHSGDTLDLRPLHCKITLTSGELTSQLGNVSLLGPGASLLTIDGNLHNRVFNHTGFGTLSLSAMTLTNGYNYLASDAARGGCIYSASTVALAATTVASCHVLGNTKGAFGGGVAATRVVAQNSLITGNDAVAPTQGTFGAHGGGIYTSGYLLMNQTTVSANQSVPLGGGGGVSNGADATLVVSASTLSGNHAYLGGAMYIFGTHSHVLNSTISGNSATLVGGILVQQAENFSLYESTLAANTATIAQIGATAVAVGLFGNTVVRMQSSIAFGNTANSVTSDTGGPGVVIGANNLIGSSTSAPLDTLTSNPMLGPLQDNGGATFTQALPLNSPAINAGNNLSNSLFDQRGSGYPRVSDGVADIGAFESHERIFASGFELVP